MSSGLEVRLFGTLEVRAAGRPLPPLRSRKGRWLLALLALRAGREVSRDWLAGVLWPDSAETDSLRSLRQSLHDLRLALGPEALRLECGALRTLRLDVPPSSIDALAFDTAIARGDDRSLEEAVRLYRGPLLEDCAEEWCLEARRPRHQAYVAALTERAAAAAARGDDPAAADFLRLAVGAEPFREDLQRTLMEALARSGSPASALDVYRQYRELLWREMAAEPAEETNGLFRELRDANRAQSRTRPPPARHADRELPIGGPASLRPGHPLFVPLPLTELIGRDEEVREVASRLAASRLVTLTGIGGIGKSRLALRVAEDEAGDAGDGACLVELAALPDPGLVPRAVAAVLGATEVPGRTVEQAVIDTLGPRRLLLLLDNCEHVLDACAVLAEALLSRCVGLRILATSRQPLGVPGETVWRVPPLAVPPPGEVQAADRFPSVQLFARRACAADAAFEMTPQSVPALVDVCRRLDGIPLAIELAAARVPVMAVEQIAARLDDRFRFLTGGSRTALPRHQTLRATMDWSYELLSEAERALFRRLSIFAGGWTLEAAEAVCGSPEAEPGGGPPTSLSLLSDEVLDLLTRLADRSLVGVERREAAARYLMLETTREYARERLREAGEERALRERHARFFLHLAEGSEPELNGPAQTRWLRQLEEEHDNFRAALDWSLSGAPDCGLRLGGALGAFWWMRGYFSEGRERLEALLGQSGYSLGRSEPDGPFRVSPPAGDGLQPGEQRPGFRSAQAKALYYAGMLADDQGDFPAAGALFQESLALSREVGDARGAARALNGLGGQARQAGDYPEARALHSQSLAIWEELGDRWWAAASLSNLGRLALVEGEIGAARGLVEQALETQRQLQDRRAIARSLALLGKIVARLGDDARAAALQAESLRLVRELGARMPIEETLQALGQVAGERGDDAAARAAHEERLAIARETGNAWGMAESLYYLGLLASERGERERAGPLLVEGLTLWRRLGDRQWIADCLEELASLALPGQSGQYGLDWVPEDGSGGARRAARLYGAAAGLREAIGARPALGPHGLHKRHLSSSQALRENPALAADWLEGWSRPLDRTIAEALGDT